MSEYDIVFFADTDFDQSVQLDPVYEPHQPVDKSVAIENEHTQPVSSDKCPCQVCKWQQSFPSSNNTILSPAELASWLESFPDLFSQTGLTDAELERQAQIDWDEIIRYEMAQPSYPMNPGRTFGINSLGWNLQRTGATYDLIPLRTDMDGQSEGKIADVGPWDPTEGAVTHNGDRYKSPVYYFNVPALTITAPDESVQVVVPHSSRPTPRSNYDGSNIWWWVEGLLDMPWVEDVAVMDEALLIEASDDGSRKRKRED